MKKLMFVFAAVLLMIGSSVMANPSEGAAVIQEFSSEEFEDYVFLFPQFEEVQAMTMMFEEGNLFLEVKGIDHDGVARVSNNDVSGCNDCAAQCPGDNGGQFIGDGVWGGGPRCYCCAENPHPTYALSEVFSYMGLL